MASLVPIIMNTVLNEHQLVLDIVAFVAFGDFPRSRLGEKQRGKVLGNWVSRKMRTIAQFSIRDPDAEGSVGTMVPEEGMGRRGSGQSGPVGGGSFRRSAAGTTGSSLMHAESLTRMPVAEELEGEGIESRSDITPTNERGPMLSDSLEYSPVHAPVFDSPEQKIYSEPDYQYDMRATIQSPDEFDPYSQRTPAAAHNYGQTPADLNESPVIPQSDTFGGLRVANRTSSNESDNWEKDALRSMNLNR